MSLPPEARPMSVGDLFDAALRLYRSRFWRLLGIAALAQLPLAALQLLLMFRGRTYILAIGFVVSPITMTFVPLLTMLFRIDELFYYSLFPHAINVLISSMPLLLLCAAQYFIVQSLVTGALTSAIVRDPTARPPSIFGAYRLDARRAWAVVVAALAPLAIGGLGAYLIYPFCGWLYLDAVFIFNLLSDEPWALDSISDATTFIIRLLAGLLALLIYARLALAPQITILEKCGPLASLRRSWQLTATLRTLLLLFVVGLLTSFMVMLPVRAWLLWALILSGLDLPTWMDYLFPILTGASLLSSLVLVQPLQIAAQTLLYDDLRKRREGYDLEQRARRHGWV